MIGPDAKTLSLISELASEPTASRAMARTVKGVLPHISASALSIARKGLKHAHAVALGVEE
jgi:hypothetical protein